MIIVSSRKEDDDDDNDDGDYDSQKEKANHEHMKSDGACKGKQEILLTHWKQWHISDVHSSWSRKSQYSTMGTP